MLKATKMFKKCKIPSLRAYHFTKVLIFIGFLLFFEAVFISLRYSKKLTYYFVSLEYACQEFECPVGYLGYLAKSVGLDGKSKICFNKKMILREREKDTIYFAFIDSSNMSKYSVDDYSFPQMHTMTDSEMRFEIPLNTFFIMVTGEFSDKLFLYKIMRANFDLKLDFHNNSSDKNSFALSGWVFNHSYVHTEQSSTASEDSFIKGCVKLFTGLTSCHNRVRCNKGETFYEVRAGSYKTKSPAGICYNGTLYVGPRFTGGRGMNVALVNDKTLAVEDVRNFDTYENGDEFDEYLMSIQGNKILIIANEDDATNRLQQSSRDMITDFGSTIINRLSFRDHFVFVGQRGLHAGSAIEKFRKRYFSSSVEINGCLSSRGVGLLRKLPQVEPEVKVHEGVTFTGDGCKKEGGCPDDSIVVYMFSGRKNYNKPRICVNSQLFNEKQLGRGINVVVFNTISKQFVNNSTFDTFGSDGTGIPGFLDKVSHDDIVFIITHDDASYRLSEDAKHALQRFGSFYINMLHLRNAWMLIGQKDMYGFSPYEKISYSPYRSNNWSEPIEFGACIPLKIRGIVNPGTRRENRDRVDYCRQKSNMGDFCSNLNRWQHFKPSLLQNPDLQGNHKIFSLPILVQIGSLDEVVQSQLQRIFEMDGLRPENVYILYDEKAKNFSDLIKLFKFNKISFDAKSNLYQFVLLHFQVNDVIILKEGVIPTKHYLEYLAYLYDVYSQDNSLCCISAYNYHGYIGSSSFKKDLVYRTSQVPGVGYLVKMSFIRGVVHTNTTDMEALQPDVSYVTRHPHSASYRGVSPLVRSYAQGRALKPTNQKYLHKSVHEKYLKELIENSTTTEIEFLHNNKCIVDTNFTGVTTLVAFYRQNYVGDFSALKKITACLGISTPTDDHLIKGLYKGLFRFTRSLNVQVFLIGSKTKYIEYKPPSALIITL